MDASTNIAHAETMYNTSTPSNECENLKELLTVIVREIDRRGRGNTQYEKGLKRKTNI